MTTFLDAKTRLFDPPPVDSRTRSESRLKSYKSATDPRAWSYVIEEERSYILELIVNKKPGCDHGSAGSCEEEKDALQNDIDNILEIMGRVLTPAQLAEIERQRQAAKDAYANKKLGSKSEPAFGTDKDRCECICSTSCIEILKRPEDRTTAICTCSAEDICVCSPEDMEGIVSCRPSCEMFDGLEGEKGSLPCSDDVKTPCSEDDIKTPCSEDAVKTPCSEDKISKTSKGSRASRGSKINGIGTEGGKDDGIGSDANKDNGTAGKRDSGSKTMVGMAADGDDTCVPECKDDTCVPECKDKSSECGPSVCAENQQCDPDCESFKSVPTPRRPSQSGIFKKEGDTCLCSENGGRSGSRNVCCSTSTPNIEYTNQNLQTCCPSNARGLDAQVSPFNVINSRNNMCKPECTDAAVMTSSKNDGGRSCCPAETSSSMQQRRPSARFNGGSFCCPKSVSSIPSSGSTNRPRKADIKCDCNESNYGSRGNIQARTKSDSCIKYCQRCSANIDNNDIEFTEQSKIDNTASKQRKPSFCCDDTNSRTKSQEFCCDNGSSKTKSQEYCCDNNNNGSKTRNQGVNCDDSSCPKKQNFRIYRCEEKIDRAMRGISILNIMKFKEQLAMKPCANAKIGMSTSYLSALATSLRSSSSSIARDIAICKSMPTRVIDLVKDTPTSQGLKRNDRVNNIVDVCKELTLVMDNVLRENLGPMCGEVCTVMHKVLQDIMDRMSREIVSIFLNDLLKGSESCENICLSVVKESSTRYFTDPKRNQYVPESKCTSTTKLHDSVTKREEICATESLQCNSDDFSVVYVCKDQKNVQTYSTAILPTASSFQIAQRTSHLKNSLENLMQKSNRKTKGIKTCQNNSRTRYFSKSVSGGVTASFLTSTCDLNPAQTQHASLILSNTGLNTPKNEDELSSKTLIYNDENVDRIYFRKNDKGAPKPFPYKFSSSKMEKNCLECNDTMLSNSYFPNLSTTKVETVGTQSIIKSDFTDTKSLFYGINATNSNISKDESIVSEVSCKSIIRSTYKPSGITPYKPGDTNLIFRDDDLQNFASTRSILRSTKKPCNENSKNKELKNKTQLSLATIVDEQFIEDQIKSFSRTNSKKSNIPERVNANRHIHGKIIKKKTLNKSPKEISTQTIYVYMHSKEDLNKPERQFYQRASFADVASVDSNEDKTPICSPIDKQKFSLVYSKPEMKNTKIAYCTTVAPKTKIGKSPSVNSTDKSAGKCEKSTYVTVRRSGKKDQNLSQKKMAYDEEFDCDEEIIREVSCGLTSSTPTPKKLKGNNLKQSSSPASSSSSSEASYACDKCT